MKQEQILRKEFKLQELIFFGNYFYGICAVALSVEATLQQRFPLNGFLYFFIVFISTVLYYSYPYIRKTTRFSTNPRTNWYTRNYSLMWWNQLIITIILFSFFIWFAWNYWAEILQMSFIQWSLIFIFPVVAALYYGSGKLFPKYTLRKIGWLKPFVIGFIWAGMVTVYPILFYIIIHKQSYQFDWSGVLLFLKNLMFVAVLCIMFDIKDYSADYLSRLRTFVVKVGLRKTIFYILLPLSALGLITFIYYATSHQFNEGKVILNTIPFILLIVAAFSLRRRRSLMYYLVVIDGLMLVKAICGSVAIIYF